jgi:type VII secretion effector (TIGR04197 family)
LTSDIRSLALIFSDDAQDLQTPLNNLRALHPPTDTTFSTKELTATYQQAHNDLLNGIDQFSKSLQSFSTYLQTVADRYDAVEQLNTAADG